MTHQLKYLVGDQHILLQIYNMISKKTYKRLSPIEHVLFRPNMYIGSIKNEDMNLYIYDNESKSLIETNMEFNCGFES